MADVPPAVIELGRIYLRAFPEERHREQLRRRLGITDDGEPEGVRLARLNATVLDEIETDDLFEIEGWRLTRTECRVYALASLG